MTDLSYRQLRAADAETFRTLRLQSIARHPTYYEGSYQSESCKTIAMFADAISVHYYYGCYDNTNLVGTAALFKDSRPHNAHKCHVGSVYVTEGYKRQGIAKNLMLNLIKHATEKYENMLLSADASNMAAIALYTELGFTQYGLEPHAAKIDGNYIDDILMIKFLGNT